MSVHSFNKLSVKVRKSVSKASHHKNPFWVVLVGFFWFSRKQNYLNCHLLLLMWRDSNGHVLENITFRQLIFFREPKNFEMYVLVGLFSSKMAKTSAKKFFRFFLYYFVPSLLQNVENLNQCIRLEPYLANFVLTWAKNYFFFTFLTILKP